VALSNPGHFTGRIFRSRKKNKSLNTQLTVSYKNVGLEFLHKALTRFQRLYTVVFMCR